MDDKSISWDCLKDEKYMVGVYSQFSTEIANQNLLNDAMRICQDHMRANHEIFSLMQQNGWYSLSMANQQELSQIATKAQQLSSSGSSGSSAQ